MDLTGNTALVTGASGGSPEEVVIAALDAIDGTTPTVVPGCANKIMSLGYRVMPRRLMARLAQLSVAPATRSGRPNIAKEVRLQTPLVRARSATSSI